VDYARIGEAGAELRRWWAEIAEIDDAIATLEARKRHAEGHLIELERILHELLAEGQRPQKPYRQRQILAHLAGAAGQTATIAQIRADSGTWGAANRANAVITQLRRKGFVVHGSARGEWRLTDAGRAHLEGLDGPTQNR